MSTPVARSVRGAHVLITSAVDGLAHDVEESEALVGHGRYVAMCGAVVLSASLAAPTGRCVARARRCAVPTSARKWGSGGRRARRGARSRGGWQSAP
ncbi:hypothetical protein ACFQV8_01870 [Pseudonocardia benzenivorans]